MAMTRLKLASLRNLLRYGVGAISAWAIVFATICHASDSEDCTRVDSEQAVAACTRLIDAGKEKGPALASLYFNRGTTYTTLGKHAEAVADLNRAIELRKDFANAFYNRGLAYRGMNEYDRSIADFTTYLRLDPKSPETYRVRGRSYREKGDHDRALADLNEYVRRKPDDAEGYLERGLVYQGKGDFPKALAEFERILKLDPRSDAAYAAVGKILSERGDDKQALAKYDEAIRINPSAANYIARGDIHVKLKDIDRALADYQRALKADPSNALAASNVGWAFGEKGDYAEAVEYHSQAIRLDPENADSYNSRGGSLLQIANYSRAKADFDRALELKPGHEFALFNRGKALTELGQFDAAIADYDALERINPKSEGLLFQRGWTKFFKGSLDAAQADFQKAADADSEDAEAQNGLCWVLAHKDQFDKATGYCDKAVALAPTSSGALHTRGIAKLRAGLLALALADFDRAIELDPKNAGLYADRGRAHDARGDRARALADYQKAVTLPAEGFYYVQAKSQAIVRLSELATVSAQVAVAAPVAAPAAKPLAPEKRVALVIGNSAYRNVSALANPKNDAGAVAASLRRVGFNNVVEKYDLSRQELTQTLQAFGDLAEDADWAVIYYAGHGIEIGGVNYVIPIDAALKASNHVDDEALSLDRVMSTVGTAKKMKLVILDACRDNPFVPKMRSVGAARSVGRGLGRIEPPPGVLVAYAARDGLVALDGETGNSPFATALVEHLEEPGVEINLLFRKVRDAVFQTTQGKQEPYTYGSLPAQQFFFRMP
ncbi:MAG: tetratricopeptide repeat protein [Pseudorhodoplanes sp.]